MWVIDALFDAGDRPQKWDIERLLILLAADGIGRRLTVSHAHGDRLVARRTFRRFLRVSDAVERWYPETGGKRLALVTRALCEEHDEWAARA